MRWRMSYGRSRRFMDPCSYKGKSYYGDRLGLLLLCAIREKAVMMKMKG